MRLYHHDIAILECRDLRFGNAPPQDGRTVELGVEAPDAISRSHEALGHKVSAPRDLRRLRNGLRYIQFWQGEDLVGSTWICCDSGRYVDELNWLLPIGPREFWVRDVFIAQAHRGRGLFPAFLRLIARNHVDRCERAWSDVDWVNEASMRAHRNAGFEVSARVHALDLGGRLRWRSRLPAWALPVAEIEPSRRLLWLRGAALERHRALLA